MLQALNKIANRYNRYMTMVGRMKAREVLLNSSDRMLKDAGFSRELLQKGIGAWPWRSRDDDQELTPVNYNALNAGQAVRELQAYSEKELHDLGIGRGAIEEAVLHGRVGIERPRDTDTRKVA